MLALSQGPGGKLFHSWVGLYVAQVDLTVWRSQLSAASEVISVLKLLVSKVFKGVFWGYFERGIKTNIFCNRSVNELCCSS